MAKLRHAEAITKVQRQRLSRQRVEIGSGLMGDLIDRAPGRLPGEHGPGDQEQGVDEVFDRAAFSPKPRHVEASYSGYIRAEVKIEFGSLTDQRPVGDHAITPMVAEEFPGTFTQATARVVAFEVERTFWEKATILHAEYHRRPDLPMRERYSRHYSDLAALIRHPLGERSLRRLDLLEPVVHHKSRFFASAWASYETAKPGTLRITPAEFRLKELEADNAKMANMFLKPPPAFSEILATLRAAESAINSAR